MDIGIRKWRWAEATPTEIPVQGYFHYSKNTPWPKAEVRPAKALCAGRRLKYTQGSRQSQIPLPFLLQISYVT